MYAGLGYDVHRFKKGRPLVLGGLPIKHPQGLMGHSDADVLVHALMDALLGAAGLDDIGHFFPNSDARFKNISSLSLLKEVSLKITKKKMKVSNIDCTIIAEKPPLHPHIPGIKKNLALILGIPEARIGIKATTNEKMGFIGRGEGIAALAIVSLK